MYKDLSDVTGFTFRFEPETMQSAFGAEVRAPQYDVRTDAEIRRVMLDEDADIPPVVYWMMRDTGLAEGPYRRETHDLRFDISNFVPTMFGREYLKTSGHYHVKTPGGEYAYPEVYGVLSGRATYLLQKVANPEAPMEEVVVEDCIIVEGVAGDKIIMPPDYGHVTINRLPVPLVMANWVSDRFSSQYGAVEEARGFAYYLIDADGGPIWVKNPNYAQVPPLRVAEVREVPELGLTKGVPLFTAGQDDPEKMDWLNNPGEYMDAVWSGLEIVGEMDVCELED
ncbi:MAG: glucose-6-phosphate isomerase family protein [Armatimonadota bacterium]